MAGRSKTARAKAKNNFVLCVWSWFLVLGAAAAIAMLITFIVTIVTVKDMVATAPAMFGDALLGYVETKAPDMLDAYVEEKLVPGMQEAMMSFMLGPAMEDSPGDAASDESQALTLIKSKRRHARKTPCPLRDQALCETFRSTCSLYEPCRTQRTTTACMPFALSLARTCMANDCDAYYDQSLCHTVEDMCSKRRACSWRSLDTCRALEGNLTRLCQYV